MRNFNIAKHLGIAACDIKRVEEWANVFFVVLMHGRARFVSKTIALASELEFKAPESKYEFNSSCLASGDYNKFTETLTLTFNNGYSYEYYAVLTQVWAKLTDISNSAGKIYNQFVKGKYAGAKLAQ